MRSDAVLCSFSVAAGLLLVMHIISGELCPCFFAIIAFISKLLYFADREEKF